MDHPITYRGYRISENDFRAHPDWRKVRWCFVHEDFDGADDGNDHRCGYEASIEACLAEIDMREDEEAEPVEAVRQMLAASVEKECGQ